MTSLGQQTTAGYPLMSREHLQRRERSSQLFLFKARLAYCLISGIIGHPRIQDYLVNLKHSLQTDIFYLCMGHLYEGS